MPTADYNGPDSFTYKAFDGALNSNVATVSITVNPVNDAPVASNGTLTTAEDTPATGTLAASDVDGDALTYSIVLNGTKGTATITNAATGAYTYTPNPNANGADSFTFNAHDAALNSNTATVSVTITPVNDAPVASNGTLTTPEDTPASGTLAATDIDGDALTYTIVTNGTKGTAAITNAATGAFTYTPSSNANGTDTITFKARDAALDSNTATVTITITPVNDAPVAAGDSFTTNEDTTIAVVAPGILANDTDVDAGDTRTAVLVAGTTHGALTFNADGSFSYTPASNFNGTDTFTYQAKDVAGALSNIATVTITVTPVNDAPVAGNDAYSTNEDTALTVVAPGVLTNDTDVDTGDNADRDAGRRAVARRPHAQPERVVHLHAGSEFQRRRFVHLSGQGCGRRALERRDGDPHDRRGQRRAGGGPRQLHHDGEHGRHDRRAWPAGQRLRCGQRQR